MRYTALKCILVVSALSATIVTGARAQTWEANERVDVPRAVQLETEAQARTDFYRSIRAAQQLREAARLRPGNDPAALWNLHMAGVIYAGGEDFERASSTLLELAERAAAFGEVETAAYALIDAALAEMQMGDVSSARRFRGRAERLAMSTHLTSQAQRELTARLTEIPAGAAAAR